jgi:hypothetical protein
VVSTSASDHRPVCLAVDVVLLDGFAKATCFKTDLGQAEPTEASSNPPRDSHGREHDFRMQARGSSGMARRLLFSIDDDQWPLLPTGRIRRQLSEGRPLPRRLPVLLKAQPSAWYWRHDQSS